MPPFKPSTPVFIRNGNGLNKRLVRLANTLPNNVEEMSETDLAALEVIKKCSKVFVRTHTDLTDPTMVMNFHERGLLKHCPNIEQRYLARCVEFGSLEQTIWALDVAKIKPSAKTLHDCFSLTYNNVQDSTISSTRDILNFIACHPLTNVNLRWKNTKCLHDEERDCEIPVFVTMLKNAVFVFERRGNKASWAVTILLKKTIRHIINAADDINWKSKRDHTPIAYYLTKKLLKDFVRKDGVDYTKRIKKIIHLIFESEKADVNASDQRGMPMLSLCFRILVNKSSTSRQIKAAYVQSKWLLDHGATVWPEKCKPSSLRPRNIMLAERDHPLVLKIKSRIENI